MLGKRSAPDSHTHTCVSKHACAHPPTHTHTLSSLSFGDSLITLTLVFEPAIFLPQSLKDLH